MTMSPASSAPGSAAAAFPVQHRAAGEMAAAADQRCARRNLQRLAGPQPDAGAGVHDPFLVVAVQEDRAIAEGLRPVGHGGVIMRMGNGDGAEPADGADDVERRLVQQGDAIPQDVAGGRVQHEGALADADLGMADNAHQPVLDQAKAVHVAARQVQHGGPGLARSLGHIGAVRGRSGRSGGGSSEGG